MKTVFSLEDGKRLHDAILQGIKQNTDNGQMNYMLLSGGVDSLCVFYAARELQLPLTVVNFAFSGYGSQDRESVKRLIRKTGTDALFPDFKTDDTETVREAVSLCRQLYGRIREVKVETMYANLKMKKALPGRGNILSGYAGDDAVGYSRKDAIARSRAGETAYEVIQKRMGRTEKDEFKYVWDGWNYYTPYRDERILEIICEFTCQACNAKVGKSYLIKTFMSDFEQYRNYRKPVGLHKGGAENIAFQEEARKRGFDSALKWFNALDKEAENAGQRDAGRKVGV